MFHCKRRLQSPSAEPELICVSLEDLSYQLFAFVLVSFAHTTFPTPSQNLLHPTNSVDSFESGVGPVRSEDESVWRYIHEIDKDLTKNSDLRIRQIRRRRQPVCTGDFDIQSGVGMAVGREEGFVSWNTFNRIPLLHGFYVRMCEVVEADMNTRSLMVRCGINSLILEAVHSPECVHLVP